MNEHKFTKITNEISIAEIFESLKKYSDCGYLLLSTVNSTKPNNDESFIDSIQDDIINSGFKFTTIGENLIFNFSTPHEEIYTIFIFIIFNTTEFNAVSNRPKLREFGKYLIEKNRISLFLYALPVGDQPFRVSNHILSNTDNNFENVSYSLLEDLNSFANLWISDIITETKAINNFIRDNFYFITNANSETEVAINLSELKYGISSDHLVAYEQVTKYESITISAFDSNLDLEQNLLKNSELKRILLGLKFGIIEVEWEETQNNLLSALASEEKVKGFIVINFTENKSFRDSLIKLATKYNQYSITYSKPNGEYYFIGTGSDKNFAPNGQNLDLLYPLFGFSNNIYLFNPSRDFIFTKIGRTLEKLTDYYPTEIRSIIMYAKKVLEELR